MYKLEIILKNGVTFVDSFETEVESAAAVKEYGDALNRKLAVTTYVSFINGLVRVIRTEDISSILVYKEG